MAQQPDQTTRFRSTSAGASELPQHESKRPRLDSDVVPGVQQNDDVVRLSASGVGVGVSTGSTSAKHDRAGTPEAGSTFTEARASMVSPTSRVTINTRPLSQQSSNMDGGSVIHSIENDAAVSGSKDGSPVIINVSDVESAEAAAGDAHAPISISSSPSEVVIEICPPEDIEDSSNAAPWQHFNQDVNRRTTFSLWKSFPFATNGTKIGILKTALEVAEILEKSTTSKVREALTCITEWMNEIPATAYLYDVDSTSDDLDLVSRLTMIFSAVCRRRVNLPSDVTEADLLSFMQSFTAATICMIKSDIARLQTIGDVKELKSLPPVLSADVLRFLSNAVMPDLLTHLHKTIERSLQILPKDFALHASIAVFQENPHHILEVTSHLFQTITLKIPMSSNYRAVLPQIVSANQNFLSAIHYFNVVREEKVADALRTTTLNFVHVADEAIRQAISKQHPWLSIDNAASYLDAFARLAFIVVAVFPEALTFYTKSACITADSVEDFVLQEHAQDMYRLSLLRDFVQCGRMELRVSGIDAMAVLLVDCWKHTLQPIDAERKYGIISLITEFVRRNKLVEFLFGVDCPSQVVHRSCNVIGFVCISDNWQTSDNDLAWNAILDSPDYRSRAAILDAVSSNLEHMSLPSLVHLYSKLNELPFERYDESMQNFMARLLEKSMGKSLSEKREDGVVDMHVLTLCLHLLREGFVPKRCATEQAVLVKDNIFQWLVSKRPHDVLRRIYNHLGTAKDDQFAMLMNHIKQHTEQSTGSILGMQALLYSLNESEYAAIVFELQYVGALLEDLDHVVQTEGLDQNQLHVMITERILALCQVITFAPDSISRDHAEIVWSRILTSTNTVLRSSAWKALADIFPKLQSSNAFLDLVTEAHLPSLVPALYDLHVLAFCEASTSFDISHRLTQNYGTNDSISIPTLERIWTIMLEAEDKAVAERASDYIVKTYLKNSVIVGKNHSIVYRTYAIVVDRCISIVLDCARSCGKQIAENTLANQKESQPDHAVVKLHRSLSLLRKLLNGLRNKPQFKPSASDALGPALQTFERKGKDIELNLKFINHPELSDGRVTWSVGDENTADEIWEFLLELTGWSQIKLIKGGLQLQFKDDLTMMKAFKLNLGDLQIIKPQNTSFVGPGRATRASSPVDEALTNHFDSLYALLEQNDEIARPVYDFLVLFPTQLNVITEIRNASISPTELLPVAKPYKLRFFASSLRSCVEEESFSATPNASCLTYAVNTIVIALTHLHIISDTALRSAILRDLIEISLLALRAKVSEETSRTYFAHPETLVSNTLALWTEVQGTGHAVANELFANMDSQFLDLLMEASLHDERVWQFLAQDHRFRTQVTNALLLHEDTSAREKTANVVLRLAGVNVAKSTAKIADIRSPRGRYDDGRIDLCLKQLWQVCLAHILMQVSDRPSTNQQAGEACVAVFETVSKSLTPEVLSAIFFDLQRMLLAQHDPLNKVYCSNEMIPLNLARMLARTMQLLKEAGILPSDCAKLIRKLSAQFLFPPLSPSGSVISLKEQSMPLRDGDARAAIYGLVLRLCTSPEELSAVADELEDAAIDGDAFSLVSANERKALRTDQGYAGLRNMSNTCYLNSLFTQLFMNVKFREFIVGVDVLDSQKQRTVEEMGQLFARMQSSHDKYVSPEDVIDTITQYTGEQIDVTVQMDVDEFYNLLFDRLESQIVDVDAKQVFKSFYGGELVQQIKSRECEHVSERTEPFNAVQVDIRGKAGLAEGLAAYVEGEVLQGENKYSCTGCGKHVDAVKRACLKEIPDNLIFNLKRFDYDIMTGMRCKVNDGFSFPESIDMTPYTMKALSEEGTTFPPDIFELVGVIIHSGTAETGHYYSFIRQRPSSRESNQSWIQFNDTDVTKFDFAQLRDQAFGGSDSTFGNYFKFYNGYMLFYQRKSSIEAIERDYPFFTTQGTTNVPLSPQLESTIAMENEVSFRRYVAQDPAHAKFLRQVLEQVHHNGSSTTKHDLEDKIMVAVLDAVYTVVSRLKDAAEFVEIMTIMRSLVENCSRCALVVLQWFQKSMTVVPTLVHAFYTTSRKEFAKLLFYSYTALAPLRNTSRLANDMPLDMKTLEKLLSNPFVQLNKCWSDLQKFPRGWEQVFGLLSNIARLGEADAELLVEQNMLLKCLEIVWVHSDWNKKYTPVQLRKSYATYINAREKNRGFNNSVVMEAFAELLPAINLENDVIGDKHTGLDPSEEEQKLLGLTDSPNFDWLRRMIAGGSNDEASEKVVRELCQYASLYELTAQTLVEGIDHSRYHIAVVRFLKACLTFASCCTNRKLVVHTIRKCLASIHESEGSCSEQYYEVVESLVNSDGFPTLDKEQIRTLLLAQLPNWAPTLLMAPSEASDIRNKTHDLIQIILFRVIDEMNTAAVQADNDCMRYIVKLGEACATYANKHYLETQGRGQEHRSQLSSGQSAQVIEIMRDCLRYYSHESAEDEVAIAQIEEVIDRLEQLESLVENYEMYAQEDASSEPVSDLESFSST